MRYEKPEVARIAPALAAIQNTQSKAGMKTEISEDDYTVPPAYEADE